MKVHKVAESEKAKNEADETIEIF